MTVTRELLHYLNIVSTVITRNNADTLCVPQKIDGAQWTFFLSAPPVFSPGETVRLRITFTDAQSCFESVITETGEDYCRLALPGAFQDAPMASLTETLSRLELQYEKYGRRKEPRIEIGKSNAGRFGLASPEQKLYVNGTSVQTCAIVDASLHGVCVITLHTPVLRAIDRINVMLNFTKPEQNIVLQLHKVQTRLNKVGEKTYASISCQILEPVHFAWKERIVSMSESSIYN